ncbi:primase C-terminal domain-containing protein [Glaesserella parasuis]|uniref:primase C-terminal domain-containing protein n=1 Tax=Glaesserella parasuis TaxID=738 RepID=UPI0024368E79|nr:primase C-terminal domain-containing protein [Glaesserella parasuis]MDG6790500.1 primase C-terminal domain-containing protein [Glaesserella parasuis]
MFTKNPNSSFWRTFVFNVPAYSLDYLADFVDLSDKKLFYQYNDEVAEGRNCHLFSQIKRIGYREVLQFKKSGKNIEQFNQYLLSLLEQLNQSQQPTLHYRELKGIAKSASRWIWGRFTEVQFSQIQSNRAKKRWKVQQINKDLLIKRFGKNKPDISLKQIAKQFNVSLSTINRWGKELGWVNSKKDSTSYSNSKYQQILFLKNQGLKWREIAKKLSISEGNAKMCFKRHHQM